ncbi:MAG: hypothetical protein QOD75_1098, partial [Blastocatellia bacterium]|nr:hypothetical protein [Blastocatellia bacterium]
MPPHRAESLWLSVELSLFTRLRLQSRGVASDTPGLPRKGEAFPHCAAAKPRVYMASRSRTKHQPRLGLALSGGAARGLAHVGVLRALEEHGIAIDFVSGTSAGALVGGVYAAGMTVAEAETIGRSLHWRDIGRMTLSRL